jgi:hypothetical protein
MLCIPDSTTNDWIGNQISQNGYSQSWIGYSDLPNNDGKYEWVSGCSSSYSNFGYYFGDYCVYISSSGYWYSTIASSFSSSIACSCESLPTLSPSTRSSDNASAIIGIVVGCIVFVIMLILIFIIFFCKRTNQVYVSTINESPSSNDGMNNSDQAYTDVPNTCSSVPDDDNNNDDGGAVISSSTIELQVVVATNAFFYDDMSIDHDQEFLPIAVQV